MVMLSGQLALIIAALFSGESLRDLKAHLSELIEPRIAQHRGCIVKRMGDGFLADFASVVEAVRCAIAIQSGMADRNRAATDESRIDFRIGINVGDVIIEGEDIYGDGVIAACISLPSLLGTRILSTALKAFL